MNVLRHFDISGKLYILAVQSNARQVLQFEEMLFDFGESYLVPLVFFDSCRIFFRRLPSRKTCLGEVVCAYRAVDSLDFSLGVIPPSTAFTVPPADGASASIGRPNSAGAPCHPHFPVL